MKKPSRAAAITIGSLLLVGAAVGAAALTVQAKEPVTPSNVIGGERARIIVDDEGGTVRIEIDGKQSVLIDAKGLHIEGDVNYGGAMTDVGRSLPE